METQDLIGCEVSHRIEVGHIVTCESSNKTPFREKHYDIRRSFIQLARSIKGGVVTPANAGHDTARQLPVGS